MSGYLLNFIVYTAAMIGVIFIAVLAYKKCSLSGCSKSDFLNVEDSISIAPRKNLYVIRAGNEKFLIASDTERTSLISKLDTEEKINSKNTQSVDELPVIVDFTQKKEKAKTAEQVLKNIAKNI